MSAEAHAARVRDMAFEMLGVLEQVSKYEYAMDNVFSGILRAHIRAILKDAHSE